MVKRIIIRKFKNFKSYTYKYIHEGCDSVYTCTEKDWKVYEAKLALIESGSDEKLIDIFENSVRLAVNEEHKINYFAGR